MSISRFLLRNINIINIILILGLITFLIVFVIPSYKADITTISTTKNKTILKDDRIKEPVKRESPQPTEYTIIAEKNLFHPERRLVISKGGGQPSHKPEFVLYGTLLAGNVKVAYMEDVKSPLTTRGRGKRQRALHIGEELSGYVLSEIYNDRVVMVKGDERIEVGLLDLTYKRRGEPKKPSTEKQKIQGKKQKKPVTRPATNKRKRPFPPRPEKPRGLLEERNPFKRTD
jgi:hypothetical protein